MGIVVRPGEYKFADPNATVGAGETSLHNPNRSGLDWSGALGQIGDTAGQAGGQIRGLIDGTIDGVVDFIYETTGIDLSGPAELIEQLLSIPLGLIDATPLGSFFGLLGQFLPFLNIGDADPAEVGTGDMATSFITDILNPTGLLASIPALFDALTGGLFSGSGEGGEGTLGDIGGVFGDLFGGFLNLDGSGIGTGDFDPIAAGAAFIENVLNPTGLLASLATIVEGLLGIDAADDPLNLLTQFGDNLREFLSFDLLSGDFDPIGAAMQMLESVFAPAGALTSSTQIPPHLFGALGADGASANQLPDPSFDDPTKIGGDGIWFHDATVGRTKPGSVRTTANGKFRRMRGVWIPTKPGKDTDLGAWVHWKNLVTTGVGDVIVVAAEAFDAGGALIPDPSNRVMGHLTAPGTGNIDPSGVHTDITAPTATGWTWLGGTYKAPSGTAWVRLVFEVYGLATGGDVYFDDALHRLHQLIDASWLDNVENMPTLPATIMQGFQGIENMLATWGHLLDGLGGAFAPGTEQSGLEFPDLFSLAQSVTDQALNAIGLGEWARGILGIRDNQTLGAGMNATSEGTVRLGEVSDAAGALVLVSVPAGTSIFQMFRAAQDDKKGVFEFLAGGNGGLGIYTNVYKVNLSTGLKSRVWSSLDIAPQVSSSGVAQYVRSLIPNANQVLTAPSDLFLLEMVNAGTGTLSVAVKKSGHPNHPTETPPNWGGTRTLASTGGATPATLTDSQLTYSSTVPYVNFALANVPDDYLPPQEFKTPSAPGEYIYDIPAAAKLGDIIDLVGVGGGGSGMPEWNAGIMAGGLGGLWAGRRLIYGVDIPLGTTQLKCVVGAGGPEAGFYWVNGNPGTATVWKLMDGTVLLTCDGGPGGSDSIGLDLGTGYGPTPNPFGFQGKSYFGGGNVGINETGKAPGGGGGGATWFQFGGAGAPGRGWATLTRPTT